MKWLTSAVSAVDIFFFGGLLLLGYGASTIYPGLGPALCGLLMILYVRPLLR